MNEVLYEGKSKVVCKGLDEDSCIIRYKNTVTAQNGEKKEELAGKGQLNAAISNLIYRYVEQNGIKTHLIRELDAESVLVKKAEIIPVEVIVRNVAAGSFSKKYGVAEGALLQNTSVEFSLKNDVLGDPMMNISQITALALATKQELDEMAALALRINELLCALFVKAEIRLADFKLEFGRFGGEIILCDEISPDSCRLWDIATGQKMDKDRFRRGLGNVTDGYRDVADRLAKLSVG